MSLDVEHVGAVTANLFGQPLLRRLRHLDLEGTAHVDQKALRALASHTRPLRLRELDLKVSRRAVTAWDRLLARKALSRLTALTLTDPPAGSLRALLEPGRLPELRRLILYRLPSLKEFRALLDSPLLGRLHELRIDLGHEQEEPHGVEVVRRLCAVWKTGSLRRLGLLWSLSAEAVRVVAGTTPPPALTELELGSYRMGAQGMAALAGSPLLRQLRNLVFRNSSAGELPGLEVLAESPYVGPLLRVDILNGHVPHAAVPALRRRFGGRFAVAGRVWPQTISLGGWHRLTGDDED
jgi:hypothetical protein